MLLQILNNASNKGTDSIFNALIPVCGQRAHRHIYCRVFELEGISGRASSTSHVTDVETEGQGGGYSSQGHAARPRSGCAENQHPDA